MFNTPRGREGSPNLPPAPPQPQPRGEGKRGMFSVLGPDVVVVGNVTATADLHIDGRIEGDVRCGTLVMGAESRVVGGVAADNARLAGTVEGQVSVRQLTLERNAKIIGDIEYENISIETGAHIDGRLKHVSSVEPSRAAAAAADDGMRLVSRAGEAA